MGMAAEKEWLQLLFGRSEPAAADKETGDGGSKGNEIGDNDGIRGKFCALIDACDVAKKQYARNHHDRFFDEFEDGGREKLLISPKAAADDRVDGRENKPDEKDIKEAEAAFVGKEEGEFISADQEDEADGNR